MSLFGHFTPKSRPRRPDVAPFKVGETVRVLPEALEGIILETDLAQVIDVQRAPKDDLGPWLITVRFYGSSPWEGMFSARELALAAPRPVVEPVGPEREQFADTPVYDQVQAEALAADGFADQVERDLRILTRRNERRAAARSKGQAS